MGAEGLTTSRITSATLIMSYRSVSLGRLAFHEPSVPASQNAVESLSRGVSPVTRASELLLRTREGGLEGEGLESP
jgi:hypothetical protein